MEQDKDGIKHTNSEEHKDVCQSMIGFFDNGEPKVGIFWYDFLNNVLFGVEKTDADKAVFVNGKATINKLHKTYWQKQHHRAQAKGDTKSIFFREHNYTMIPRGRVFLDEATDKFQVFVGHWFTDGIDGKPIDKEKFRELIKDEFNLLEDFEMVVDIHWDLGHGWSEEFFEE